MTPIKIRGKRSSAQTESWRGKRPISSPASHLSSPPVKLPRHPAHNTSSETLVKRARFAAPLEQLPIELLETIFFLHPNISLPQASPFIGKKLASKHVKTQLVLRVCSAGRLGANLCEEPALFPTETDHAEAQSAILRVRWMTLTFIRQLIPEYITAVLVQELGKRRLQWLGQGPVVTTETGSTIRQYLDNKRCARKDPEQSPSLKHLTWRIENPSRLIRLSFGLDDGLVTIEERPIMDWCNSVLLSIYAKRDQWRIFHGISGCKVPRKLLNAPWTTEKCDFLEMLLRGNASVDWVGTTSGEIAEEGLMQALRGGNARATRLLVTRAGSCDPQGIYGHPCRPHCIKHLASGPWPMEDPFQDDSLEPRGVGVVPQTKHLRAAVLEAGCQRDVVEQLLMAEDTNIDFEDRSVLDWAVEKSLLGDERGPWLLSKLSSRADASTKLDC